ncbi:MAG: Spy/CpxP family protein refolding chaperone, partial [Longimicrobiales bacterium]
EEALGLTDEQVSRLEEIRDEHSNAQRQRMTEAMSAHQEARQAVQGDTPDFDAYEEALRHASEHMVQGHLSMARAAAESRNALTEEQRNQLQQGMGMMQGMMGGSGMGDGMMQGRGQGRGAPR